MYTLNKKYIYNNVFYGFDAIGVPNGEVSDRTKNNTEKTIDPNNIS